MQSRPLLGYDASERGARLLSTLHFWEKGQMPLWICGRGPADDRFGKCPVRRLLDGRMTIKYGILNALHLKWKRI